VGALDIDFVRVAGNVSSLKEVLAHLENLAALVGAVFAVAVNV
jgi:hypothetical protein